MDGPSKLVSLLCTGTSFCLTMFWVSMTPVEADIVDDINEYIFKNMYLKQMSNYQEILKFFNYTCLPLAILIAFCKSLLVYQKKVLILLKAAEIIVIVVNGTLLVFLFFKAQKLLCLLKLYLLYLSINLASSNIMITPQIFISFAVLCLIYFAAQYCFAREGRQNADNNWLKECVRVILSYCIFILIRSCVITSLQSVAVDCSILPAKPFLTGHRGCKDNYPENSLVAFEEVSSHYESVSTLETDVHISYNGVPFLLHDDTLVRTTDIISKCPTIHPLTLASLLNYSLPGSTCDLKKLRITQQPISPLQSAVKIEKLIIPTFRDFLAIAVAHNKAVIFDVNEPQSPDHPYHKGFTELLIETIKISNIHEEKVWWLYKEDRSRVRDAFPKMIQATKTKETPFEEFEKDGISLINDDWTIPEHLIKKYKNTGLLLNIWVINSRPLFEIFWCHGVDSITTNACDYLNKIDTNAYHEAYVALLTVSDATGIYISVVMFVILTCYCKRDSEKDLSAYVLPLLSHYCVLITIATVCHVVYLYINVS